MALSSPNPNDVPALRCASAIDEYLDTCTRSLAERLPPTLLDAIRYALLGGGKRLRPILAWHSCTAAGGEGNQSLPAGAALELVHAFSLVHDDLPAMDNDTLRRGMPTLHVRAGEAMAILAGDALMALAFQHLVDACPAHRSVLLVRELSQATTDMITGQVYDTLGSLPADASDIENVHLIHRNKTGALIRAACRMGALCADADQSSLHALTTYADAVGLMYQIIDDLLDIEATAVEIGKKTGKDSSAGKLTYPAVLGVDESRREVQRLEGVALDALDPLGATAEPLRELCRYMATRRN